MTLPLLPSAAVPKESGRRSKRRLPGIDPATLWVDGPVRETWGPYLSRLHVHIHSDGQFQIVHCARACLSLWRRGLPGSLNIKRIIINSVPSFYSPGNNAVPIARHLFLLVYRHGRLVFTVFSCVSLYRSLGYLERNTLLETFRDSIF